MASPRTLQVLASQLAALESVDGPKAVRVAVLPPDLAADLREQGLKVVTMAELAAQLGAAAPELACHTVSEILVTTTAVFTQLQDAPREDYEARAVRGLLQMKEHDAPFHDAAKQLVAAELVRKGIATPARQDVLLGRFSGQQDGPFVLLPGVSDTGSAPPAASDELQPLESGPGLWFAGFMLIVAVVAGLLLSV